MTLDDTLILADYYELLDDSFDDGGIDEVLDDGGIDEVLDDGGIDEVLEQLRVILLGEEG